MSRKTLYAACITAVLLFFPPLATAAVPGPQQAMAPEEAFAYAETLAGKGDIQAMLAMGGFYEQGIGTYRDYTKALGWYRKAAAAGSPEGIYNVAVCLEVGMGATADRAKAVEGFLQAADMGLVQAQYKLSALHADGMGVPQDDAKAVAYLAKAADAGHATAANDLGVIHLHGLLGQKQDGSEALKRFLQAAERGNLEAVKNIAAIFRDGLGQPVNHTTALKWFLIAQKGGYPAPELPEVIESLKRSLEPDLVSFAEGQANQWIADFQKKLNTTNPR